MKPNGIEVVSLETYIDRQVNYEMYPKIERLIAKYRAVAAEHKKRQDDDYYGLTLEFITDLEMLNISAPNQEPPPACHAG